MKRKINIPEFNADVSIYLEKNIFEKRVLYADKTKIIDSVIPQIFRGRFSTSTNYMCIPGGGCICIGDDDCNKMFTIENCGPRSYCTPYGCVCK